VTDKTAPARESLAQILGGRRGALDASVPPGAFVLGWLIAGRSIAWGAGVAIAVAVLLGVFRLLRGEKARAVVISLAGVAAAALIALRTGRAEDFFLVQLLSNVVSALLWAASIGIRCCCVPTRGPAGCGSSASTPCGC
jgi:hypothetical protein